MFICNYGKLHFGVIHHISKAGEASPSLGIMLCMSHWIRRHKITTSMELLSECFIPKTKVLFGSKEKKSFFQRGVLVPSYLKY